MRCRPTNPRRDATYQFGRFELRPATRQLLVDRQPATLGARAFDLLLALIERARSPGHQGRVARSGVARTGRRGEQPAGAGLRAAQAAGAGGHRYRRRPRVSLHARTDAGRRVRTTAAARRQAQPARAGLVVHRARARAHGFARDACAPPAGDAHRRRRDRQDASGAATRRRRRRRVCRRRLVRGPRAGFRSAARRQCGRVGARGPGGAGTAAHRSTATVRRGPGAPARPRQLRAPASRERATSKGTPAWLVRG